MNCHVCCKPFTVPYVSVTSTIHETEGTVNSFVAVVQELEGASSLVLSVHDDVGIRTVMDELMAASKNPAPGMRRVRNLLSVLTRL